MTPCLSTSAMPLIHSTSGRVSSTSGSAITKRGAWKAPIRFLPCARSAPVLPPRLESTIANKEVGTTTQEIPRRKVAAAKPARSPTTPPPRATTVLPRSIPADRNACHNLDTVIQGFMRFSGRDGDALGPDSRLPEIGNQQRVEVVCPNIFIGHNHQRPAQPTRPEPTPGAPTRQPGYGHHNRDVWHSPCPAGGKNPGGIGSPADNGLRALTAGYRPGWGIRRNDRRAGPATGRGWFPGNAFPLQARRITAGRSVESACRRDKRVSKVGRQEHHLPVAFGQARVGGWVSAPPPRATTASLSRRIAPARFAFLVLGSPPRLPARKFRGC